MVALVAKAKPAFEPGEKAQYSNSNYVLLGYIVEKAGGRSYEDALKQRITLKIGLKDTYLGTGYPDAGKNEAFSYSFISDWKQESDIHLSIPGGAGAIISTPNDLTKFIQALFDGKIVSKESLEQMKPRDKYGLGINSYLWAAKQSTDTAEEWTALDRYCFTCLKKNCRSPTLQMGSITR
jgi:CubicO group peptidase (beta-lactamase class C family)